MIFNITVGSSFSESLENDLRPNAKCHINLSRNRIVRTCHTKKCTKVPITIKLHYWFVMTLVVKIYKATYIINDCRRRICFYVNLFIMRY